MYIDESMASGAIQRISEDQWQIEGCPHHGPAIASAGAPNIWPGLPVVRIARLFYAHASNRDGLFLVSHPQPFGLPGSERPSVAATGGEVVLAWKRFEHDRTRVYAQKSLDGGQSWQPAKVVAESLGGSDHPLLTVIDQQVFLSWKSDPEGYRLISSILTRSPYHEATHLMAFPGRHGGGQLGHSSFSAPAPLTAERVPDVFRPTDGVSRVMVLWSVDCAPCLKRVKANRGLDQRSSGIGLYLDLDG